MNDGAQAVEGGFDDAAMEARVLSHLGMGDVPQKKAPAPAPQAPQAAPQAAPQEAPEAPESAEPVEAVETQEAEAPADNLIEIDFKGGKYKLPAELKELHEGHLRQEDYTRKTQDLAERQKVIDLQEQQAHSQRALQQAVQPYLERLVTLNNQISQYANVDWAAYSDQDAAAANKHWMTYQSLKERKQGLEGEMQGAAAQHLNKLKEAADNLRKENSKILSEKVKGWGTERDTQVRAFAKETYGFSEQELGSVFDARILRLMNDAKDLHDLRSAKPVRQAPPAQKTLKPSATQTQATAKVKEAEIKKSIRSAKSDESKARGIQTLLEHRLR